MLIYLATAAKLIAPRGQIRSWTWT